MGALSPRRRPALSWDRVLCSSPCSLIGENVVLLAAASGLTKKNSTDATALNGHPGIVEGQALLAPAGMRAPKSASSPASQHVEHAPDQYAQAHADGLDDRHREQVAECPDCAAQPAQSGGTAECSDGVDRHADQPDAQARGRTGIACLRRRERRDCSPLTDEAPKPVSDCTAKLLHNGRAYLPPSAPGRTVRFDEFLAHVRLAVAIPAPAAGRLKWTRLRDACTISSDLELAEALRLMPADCPTFWVLLGEPECPDSCVRARLRLCTGKRRSDGARQIRLLLGHALKEAGAPPPCGAAGCAGRRRRGCLRGERCRLRAIRRAAAGCCGPPVLSVKIFELLPMRTAAAEVATDESGNGGQLPPATSSWTVPSQHRRQPPLDAFNCCESLAAHLRQALSPTQLQHIEKIISSLIKDAEWVHTEKSVFEQATNHPFLVGLHSCFQTDNRLFFIIEFVSGGDLMFHMQRHRKLPESSARFYAAEVSCALHFLHERVTQSAYPYQALALTHPDTANPRSSKTCRTRIRPDLLRPAELHRPGSDSRAAVRHRRRLLALGVMLYEMLTGRSPWCGSGLAGGSQRPVPPYRREVPIRPPAGLSRRATEAAFPGLLRPPASRSAWVDARTTSPLCRGTSFFAVSATAEALEARC
uniref:Protein kinase domain-containing protein n=1 Tax=Macrostomum lignano TaxID=282301 RepID=A0A1I8FH15_9PLAT